MKRISLVIIVSMFFTTSYFFISCKNDETPTTPSEAEIIESSIQSVLDSIIKNTDVPGLVAGVWAPNEGIDFVYSAGVSNIETKAPMDADMIFRIGSNTKTMTNTVFLQLVDEGIVNLNDKLSNYIPDFPRADEVTLEMLTNMRSGIYNYTDTQGFMIELMSNYTKLWTSDELIAFAADSSFYFDPGTGFHYSNTNTIMLDMVIEMVTGVSLESNIRTRIIDPLDLINTVYLIAGTELQGYHSSAYYFGEYDPEAPECSEMIDISWGAAAGSAISTIFELKTYVEALNNGTFLSDSLQQHRMDCHSMSDPHGREYGMGIFKYKDFYGHNGGLWGYTSLMMNSPDRNCTIIIWYNCQLHESGPTDLLYIIPKLIYREI